MIRNDLPRGLIDNPMLDRWVGFEGEGAVRLGTGKVELGQGVLTALRQIAAEELRGRARPHPRSSPARPGARRKRA